MFDERSYNALMLSHWLFSNNSIHTNTSQGRQKIELMTGSVSLNPGGLDFDPKAPLPLYFSVWVRSGVGLYQVVIEGPLSNVDEVSYVDEYASLLGPLLPSHLCTVDCPKGEKTGWVRKIDEWVIKMDG